MSEISFLVKLRDSLQQAADAVNEYLETKAPKETPKSTIAWKETEGPKGKYELSEDVNNLEFKQLIKDERSRWKANPRRLLHVAF